MYGPARSFPPRASYWLLLRMHLEEAAIRPRVQIPMGEPTWPVETVHLKILDHTMGLGTVPASVPTSVNSHKTPTSRFRRPFLRKVWGTWGFTACHVNQAKEEPYHLIDVLLLLVKRLNWFTLTSGVLQLLQWEGERVITFVDFACNFPCFNWIYFTRKSVRLTSSMSRV